MQIKRCLIAIAEVNRNVHVALSGLSIDWDGEKRQIDGEIIIDVSVLVSTENNVADKIYIWSTDKIDWILIAMCILNECPLVCMKKERQQLMNPFKFTYAHMHTMLWYTDCRTFIDAVPNDSSTCKYANNANRKMIWGCEGVCHFSAQWKIDFI